MYGFMYDPFFILVILAAVLAFFAQMRVSGTFNKYSRVENRKGYSGADVARQLLMISGIRDVSVERVAGNLTDHYDPVNRVLRLSDSVYSSHSVAALGVAAHETGHAIQHAEGYVPLSIRSGIFPVVSFSSQLATPLIMIGFILMSLVGSFGLTVVYIGIALFSAVVAFQIITLPVEFNASSRALDMLEGHNFLSSDEIVPARKVLNAAALTYVAAALVSIANLIRFAAIAFLGGRRDD